MNSRFCGFASNFQNFRNQLRFVACLTVRSPLSLTGSLWPSTCTFAPSDLFRLLLANSQKAAYIIIIPQRLLSLIKSSLLTAFMLNTSHSDGIFFQLKPVTVKIILSTAWRIGNFLQWLSPYCRCLVAQMSLPRRTISRCSRLMATVLRSRPCWRRLMTLASAMQTSQNAAVKECTSQTSQTQISHRTEIGYEPEYHYEIPRTRHARTTYFTCPHTIHTPPLPRTSLASQPLRI